MPNRRSMTAGTAVASIPLALGLLAPAVNRGPQGAAARAATRGKAAPPKEFSVPLANLRTWAGSVVVTLNNVAVEGRSKVHKLADDCEMHFGAHTSAFQGSPDGLVLEPMNVCVQPFPGKSEQDDKDWNTFGDQMVHNTVTATGVPRIWPEHLDGGTESNPDHAVELHPLLEVTLKGTKFDFTPNVFEGEYEGGVGEETALAIVRRTTVAVTRNAGSVDISFRGGRIGNFTRLEIAIERASIEGDGDGSFRMNGDVIVDDSTTVPVRIVTVKGTRMNDAVARMRSSRRNTLHVEALVLFSLSPEGLLAAANKSSAQRAVKVERPIQLIVYGTPDDH